MLLQGFTSDGYFAEYVVVDWQNAIILPKELKVEQSAPLFCAGITGKLTAFAPLSTTRYLIKSQLFTPSIPVSSSPDNGLEL